jgi:2-succinyl-5-enolpyruvyl-6-hydroxy-3-cyclohexene-1-carboxylate synthase
MRGSRVCYDLEPGYKKMLLVGVNDPDALSENIIETLAADESVVVLTETTSNVHPTFINTIDTLITLY